MRSIWIMLLITARLSKRVIGNYQCTMTSLEVTCSGITGDQISENVSVTLHKMDIVTLNITNGIISTISPSTFRDFTNLQSLYVTYSGISMLENDAFSNSSDLQDLSLSNNALVEFNSRSLSPENSLKALDLSYNLLNDFSDFNIDYFPRLTMLNLASNFLSYLPVSLLRTLEEQTEFYLVADNNPWNCSDVNWSEHLTEKLIDAFCTNKTFSYEPRTRSSAPEFDITERTTNTEFTEIITESTFDINQWFLEGKTKNETNHNITQTLNEKLEGDQCEKPSCLKCSFYFCLVWFICGIWIGIIIGNVGKIRSLICVKPVTYTDEYTQCEYSLIEQPGAMELKARRAPPIGNLGLPSQNKEKI